MKSVYRVQGVGVFFAVLLAVFCLQAGPPEQALPTSEEIRQGLAKRLEQGKEERARFAEHYRYVHSRIREEHSSKGKLRKRTEETQRHDPEASDKSESENDAGEKKRRAYGEQDLVFGGDLVERFVYTAEARERLDEQDVLRVAFRPSSLKKLPERNALDRFVNRTAGTLWLEPESMALVRAEMALMEKVTFLGGIAGVVFGLEMTFERACADPGVWYTRLGKWRADYRQFLVRKIVDFEERREEVERVR